jgi:hypothetical protein
VQRDGIHSSQCPELFRQTGQLPGHMPGHMPGGSSNSDGSSRPAAAATQTVTMKHKLRCLQRQQHENLTLQVQIEVGLSAQVDPPDGGGGNEWFWSVQESPVRSCITGRSNTTAADHTTSGSTVLPGHSFNTKHHKGMTNAPNTDHGSSLAHYHPALLVSITRHSLVTNTHHHSASLIITQLHSASLIITQLHSASLSTTAHLVTDWRLSCSTAQPHPSKPTTS